MKYKTNALLILALMVAGMTSCADNDKDSLKDLAAPQLKQTGDSGMANALCFEWNKVEGAYQYAYKLYDPNDKLVGFDLLYDNYAQFINLNPNTSYKLNVNAYSRVSGDDYKSSSEVATITATTAPLKYEVAVDGPQVNIGWGKMQDVKAVNCVVENENKEVVYSGLIDYNGSYANRFTTLGNYTFYISKYVNTLADTVTISAPSVTFQIDALKRVLWTVTGKAYLQGVGQTIDAVMTAYDDGTYIIENWYGGTSSLEFSINSDATIRPLNASVSTSTNFTYYVGRSEDDDDIYLADISTKNSFAYSSVDEKTSVLESRHGKLALTVYVECNSGDEAETTGDGTYTFEW